MWITVKNFISDLLYPQFCFNCGKEGNYLCQDCQSIIEILNTHQKHQTQNLKDLYFALPYQNLLIKNLIKKFKYQPFVKELAQPLASLIITHFQLLDKKPNFFCPLRLQPTHRILPPSAGPDQKSSNGADYIFIPVPLEKKKLKQRGFNQAEEIGKELSKFLKISLLNNVLAKIKETPPQVDLSDEERKENIKGVFIVRNGDLIKNRKILLVDDIYTTGSTLEECAKVLKKAGAKEIIGIVVARG
jgi:predicted amidophosphoribosyltransferase